MEKRKYHTKQKEEILLCIAAFGEKHFTAADVAAKLAREGSTVGQATVYRTLERLAAEGELRKYVIDGTTAACYQQNEADHAADCHEHFHLKCEVCGRLIHVECEELSKIASHMEEEHGFLVDPKKTVFYGICEKCK
jgi:Fur family ferric uptake transcriptional regulator